MTLTISVKRGDREIVCRLFESQQFEQDGQAMVRMLPESDELKALADKIKRVLEKE
jgi:hypothetical protein